MDLAISCLSFVFVLFSFTFSLFDIQKNMTMKQSLFETVRAANQNSLLSLQQDYEKGITFTTPQMLEEWISQFVTQNSLNYDSITLGFVQLEAEPPLYLVTAEGKKNDYTIIKDQAYVRYTSGALLIDDE